MSGNRQLRLNWLFPAQAIATAADIATRHQSRVTVLVVDEEEPKQGADPSVRLQNISWYDKQLFQFWLP